MKCSESHLTEDTETFMHWHNRTKESYLPFLTTSIRNYAMEVGNMAAK